MERWSRVQEQLEDFRRYFHPNFPLLIVQSMHDLTADRAKYLELRKSGLFRQYGVYLFFSDEGELQYVGSAIYAFDNRIFAHDFAARWVDVVTFDELHWPFLLALEAFLICRLKPALNSIFKIYDVPRLPLMSD